MQATQKEDQKLFFQDRLSVNAGHKYIAECSKGSILQYTFDFIKLPFVIKIFVLSFLSGRFTQVLLYIQDSHMMALVLLNLLKEMGKKDQLQGYAKHLITFSQ